MGTVGEIVRKLWKCGNMEIIMGNMVEMWKYGNKI
jgi:hypothetical protein